MPNGEPALLLQVIDTGPGLQGVSYQTLFDPSSEFGACITLATSLTTSSVDRGFSPT